MGSRPQYDAFVITAPGLERLAVDELKTLGRGDAWAVEGGATFAATRQTLYEANLHLRTASRVVVRAAEFGAKAFHELERRAAKVPWEAFVSPSLAVSLRVTCRKSRLYHSDAVAERVAGAIMSRVTGVHLAPVGKRRRQPAHSRQAAARPVHDQRRQLRPVAPPARIPSGPCEGPVARDACGSHAPRQRMARRHPADRSDVRVGHHTYRRGTDCARHCARTRPTVRLRELAGLRFAVCGAMSFQPQNRG